MRDDRLWDLLGNSDLEPDREAMIPDPLGKSDRDPERDPIIPDPLGEPVLDSCRSESKIDLRDP